MEGKYLLNTVTYEAEARNTTLKFRVELYCDEQDKTQFSEIINKKLSKIIKNDLSKGVMLC